MQLHGWGKVEGGKLVFRYYQISAICYSLFYAYASSSFMHVAQKILGGKIKFQLQLTQLCLVHATASNILLEALDWMPNVIASVFIERQN